MPGGALHAAGDVRGNVDPPVLAFQTLWLREHNRLAGELAKQHPEWDDETLFQEARKWNIAYMQVRGGLRGGGAARGRNKVPWRACAGDGYMNE